MGRVGLKLIDPFHTVSAHVPIPETPRGLSEKTRKGQLQPLISCAVFVDVSSDRFSIVFDINRDQ